MPTWTSAHAQASQLDTCPECWGKDRSAHPSPSPGVFCQIGFPAPWFSAWAAVLPLLVSPTFPVSLCSFPHSDFKIRLKGTGGGNSFTGWICPFSNARKWKGSISASPTPCAQRRKQNTNSEKPAAADGTVTQLRNGPTAQKPLSPPAVPDSATPSSRHDVSHGVPNQEGEVGSKRGGEA